MIKTLKPCNALNGVLPGQTATLDLAIGPRYHFLRLQIDVPAAVSYRALLGHCIGLINVKLGGNVQRSFTALELDALNTLESAYNAVSYYNVSDSNTTPADNKAARFILTIPFAQPWRKSYAATESFALPTVWADGSSVGTFQLELFIPAKVANMPDGMTIKAFAETDDAFGPVNAQNQPVRNIVRFERLVIPYSGAGEFSVTTLQKRDLVQSIHLFQDTDAISSLKIEVDSSIKRDVTKIINDQALVERGMNKAGLSAQRFDLVFDASDLPTDALPLNGVRDFKVTPTMAAAAATNKVITLISQVYGPIV